MNHSGTSRPERHIPIFPIFPDTPSVPGGEDDTLFGLPFSFLLSTHLNILVLALHFMTTHSSSRLTFSPSLAPSPKQGTSRDYEVKSTTSRTPSLWCVMKNHTPHKVSLLIAILSWVIPDKTDERNQTPRN